MWTHHQGLIGPTYKVDQIDHLPLVQTNFLKNATHNTQSSSSPTMNQPEKGSTSTKKKKQRKRKKGVLAIVITASSIFFLRQRWKPI